MYSSRIGSRSLPSFRDQAPPLTASHRDAPQVLPAPIGPFEHNLPLPCWHNNGNPTFGPGNRQLINRHQCGIGHDARWENSQKSFHTDVWQADRYCHPARQAGQPPRSIIVWRNRRMDNHPIGLRCCLTVAIDHRHTVTTGQTGPVIHLVPRTGRGALADGQGGLARQTGQARRHPSSLRPFVQMRAADINQQALPRMCLQPAGQCLGLPLLTSPPWIGLLPRQRRLIGNQGPAHCGPRLQRQDRVYRRRWWCAALHP